MQIECATKTTASKVKAVLFKYNISSHEVGPFINEQGDSSTIVMVNQAINSTDEPAVRRELGRIGGAKVND